MSSTNRIKFLLTFVAGLAIFTLKVQSQTYGLKFNGIDSSIDNRTELNLTPDDYLTFQNDFEISFDYKIRRKSPNGNRGLFGYILRIINQDNINVDLLSSVVIGSSTLKLNVVCGILNSMLEADFPESGINNWIHLRVKFNLSKDQLILYTPEAFYVQENVGFNKGDAFKIIFGVNDFKQFKTSDVPAMSIRDIKISQDGKLKYHWPLDQTVGTESIDRLKKKKAVAINPSWLGLSHQVWDLHFDEEIDGLVMYASNDETGESYLIGEEELTVFSNLDNSVRKVAYKNKNGFKDIDRVKATDYRAFYNKVEDEIYCYLNKDESYFVFDMPTREWTTIPPSGGNSIIHYRHHNRYFNASENAIYLFGGYGRHNYYNEIRKFNISDNTFKYLSTNDSIYPPRYLAGLGVLNDTVYVLGGYGSKSGNQLINPQSYHDLVGYSIKENKLFKKFEIPHIIDDMCVANSMWIDSVSRNYYALIFEKNRFNGELRLLKGSLESPKVELVGSTIPFEFLDVRSSAGLKYIEEQKKLYAFTMYKTDSTFTKAKIYSINYPPNAYVEDEEELKVSLESNSILYLTIGGVLALLLGGFLYYTKRSRKNVVVDESNQQVREELVKPAVTSSFDDSAIETPDYQLIFFGGFQVINKNSEDITKEFTPLLKELFLLILLHTFKNNKGISTEKITEILWYDKSEKSARNNRAVNLAKLRGLLLQLGDFKLSKSTGYWKSVFDDATIKSDYVDFLNLTLSKEVLNKQQIYQLIEITKKGQFLRNVQNDWLDEFKARVSDTIIDALLHFANNSDIKNDANFIIDLTDSIFIFDVTNEDAMTLKCRAQYEMGKHSHAKATYKKFTTEYLEMYGEAYEHSFVDILK